VSSFAQDLAPRAYVITPTHANAVTLTWSFYKGGLYLNGAIPVTESTGTYNIPVLSYYHSFSFFGRSANVTASLPYAFGTFEGDVLTQYVSIRRSGLADFTCRFTVNLKGGPAMDPSEFHKWRQKTIVGLSLKVVAPTGQYDSTKVINWGINKWAFKPELGYSRRWGNWVLDTYGGVWFYTTNPASFDLPVPQPLSENPIGAFEGHFSYDFHKLRGWMSVDGNLWFGGTTTLNGIRNTDTRQTSSRLGGTVSLPLFNHQSVKIAYSRGTYVRFGGNYGNLQVAWQYSWIGRPR